MKKLFINMNPNVYSIKIIYLILVNNLETKTNIIMDNNIVIFVCLCHLSYHLFLKNL